MKAPFVLLDDHCGETGAIWYIFVGSWGVLGLICCSLEICQCGRHFSPQMPKMGQIWLSQAWGIGWPSGLQKQQMKLGPPLIALMCTPSPRPSLSQWGRGVALPPFVQNPVQVVALLGGAASDGHWPRWGIQLWEALRGRGGPNPVAQRRGGAQHGQCGRKYGAGLCFLGASFFLFLPQISVRKSSVINKFFGFWTNDQQRPVVASNPPPPKWKVAIGCVLVDLWSDNCGDGRIFFICFWCCWDTQCFRCGSQQLFFCNFPPCLLFRNSFCPFALLNAASSPGENKSQFFITFSACQHLDGKHTIFGKLVGVLHQILCLSLGEMCPHTFSKHHSPFSLSMSCDLQSSMINEYWFGELCVILPMRSSSSCSHKNFFL